LWTLGATTRRLRKALERRGTPAWVGYGDLEFPYFGDGDLQEVYYHANFRQWFDGEFGAFSKCVRGGNVAIDVGANLGFITLVLSKLVGDGGRVYSFEPSSRTYAKLEHVIERNRLSNVTPLNYALGAETCELPLATPQSSGNASLALEGVGAKAVELVRIQPLDAGLGSELSRLDFIKIDTEGFEIEVLRGAEQTITRLRPVIFIELAAEFFESSSRSIVWLKERGYEFPIEPDFRVAKNGANFFAVPR
jgi:FkbM family methyltransferase